MQNPLESFATKWTCSVTYEYSSCISCFPVCRVHFLSVCPFVRTVYYQESTDVRSGHWVMVDPISWNSSDASTSTKLTKLSMKFMRIKELSLYWMVTCEVWRLREVPLHYMEQWLSVLTAPHMHIEGTPSHPYLLWKASADSSPHAYRWRGYTLTSIPIVETRKLALSGFIEGISSRSGNSLGFAGRPHGQMWIPCMHHRVMGCRDFLAISTINPAIPSCVQTTT